MTSIGLIFMAYDYVSNHYEFYGYNSTVLNQKSQLPLGQ